ncbi:MAG: 5-oxoprolinase subunit PxpA [Limnobacter sp.]|uniref:5-oxoprolinase subunit PxpA n=1 Tax=Limnobacter sp. TaxID=2003368 RepID=UPI00391CB9AA
MNANASNSFNWSNSISINADLGEGGANDEALFGCVDLANIACGGHAGDESTMRRACELALAHGVSVGAHPSYPDRDGFGRRRPSHLNHSALLDEICRQVEAFEAVARSVGLAPQHFKPHGQLYNDAAVDEALALLLIDVARHFPHLALLALAASPQVSLSRSAGITVLEEAFPDRAYTPMGTLVPRSQTGALIDNEDVLTLQTKAMVRALPFASASGEPVVVRANTLCVHGDTTHALRNARLVRAVVSQP